MRCVAAVSRCGKLRCSLNLLDGLTEQAEVSFSFFNTAINHVPKCRYRRPPLICRCAGYFSILRGAVLAQRRLTDSNGADCQAPPPASSEIAVTHGFL